jgi:low affinity Fe/Cu permease
MKLTPKTAQLSAMASMVLIMTGVVVLISTLVNFGLATGFWFRFARSWAMAFVLAFPLVVLLMPRLQRFFQGLVAKDGHGSVGREIRAG